MTPLRFSDSCIYKFSVLLLFLLFLVLPIASDANDARDRWVDELASHFLTIATGREYLTDSRYYVTTKSRSDEIITYLIIGQADEEQREIVRNHLADLSRLTGLVFRDVSMEPIQVSPNPSTSALRQNPGELLREFRLPDPSWGYAHQGQNEVPGLVTDHLVRFAQGNKLVWWRAKLLIFIADTDSMNAIGRQIGLTSATEIGKGTIRCAALFKGGVWSHPDVHFIRTASVFIPNSKSTLFSRCAVEELTQILGLPNDIFDSPITRFNERLDGPPELTIFDELFLRILYNPTITPGLAGEELRALVVPLIENELLRNPDLAHRPTETR
jgi:hypothetical protein